MKLKKHWKLIDISINSINSHWNNFFVGPFINAFIDFGSLYVLPSWQLSCTFNAIIHRKYPAIVWGMWFYMQTVPFKYCGCIHGWRRSLIIALLIKISKKVWLSQIQMITEAFFTSHVIQSQFPVFCCLDILSSIYLISIEWIQF